MEASSAVLYSPRLIAVVLSIGGLFWGTILLLLGGPVVLVFPFTAAGYAITAAYITRVLWEPPIGACWLIWIASIAVQGFWLCLVLIDLFGYANPGSGGLFCIAWWLFATASSCVALVNEQENTQPEVRTDE